MGETDLPLACVNAISYIHPWQMKDCPNCKLINPDSAIRCDCGYDFPSGNLEHSYLTHKEKKLAGGAVGGIFLLYLLTRLILSGASATYRSSHGPPTPAPVSAEEADRVRQLKELQNRMAEFKAKEAASHDARTKRLGEAGAKAQEDRCDAELMAAFQAAVDKKPELKTPDCEE